MTTTVELADLYIEANTLLSELRDADPSDSGYEDLRNRANAAESRYHQALQERAL